MGGDLDDVGARRRLAAGQVDVQDAERRRLAEHALSRSRCRARPSGGRARAGSSSRGSAAGSDGSARRGGRSAAGGGGRVGVQSHRSTTRLPTRSSSISMTSPSITARSASNRAASSSTMAPIAARARRRARAPLAAVSSRSKARSGASRTCALRDLVEAQPHAARQARHVGHASAPSCAGPPRPAPRRRAAAGPGST